MGPHSESVKSRQPVVMGVIWTISLSLHRKSLLSLLIVIRRN